MPKQHRRTRKRIQKRASTHRRRVLKGGADNEIQFQYTTRRERIDWVTALYPLGNLVLGAVKAIPWGDYTYEGEAGCSFYPPEEKKNSPKKEVKFKMGMEEPEKEKGVVMIEARSQKVPYFVLGGAACEVWNKAHPAAGNLHKTTEPTADIDIRLANPAYKVKGYPRVGGKEIKIDGDVELLWMNGDTYTDYADHYSKWMYANAIVVAQAIAPYFPKKVFQAPDREDTDETSISDLHTTVGPILVSRTHRGDMIKIQLSTKLASGHADHFVEFIIITNEEIKWGDEQFINTTRNLDGIYVEGVYELMLSQIRALKGRQAAEKEIRYKLINHYGRLLYLSHLLEYAIRNKLQAELGPHQYRILTEVATKDKLFDPQEDVCPPPKGCSKAAYIAPLCTLRYAKSGLGKECEDAVEAMSKKGGPSPKGEASLAPKEVSLAVKEASLPAEGTVSKSAFLARLCKIKFARMILGKRCDGR